MQGLGASIDPVASDSVRDALQEVFARPEFDTGQGPVERALDRFLSEVGGGASELSAVLVQLLPLVLALLVAAFVLARLRRRSALERGEGLAAQAEDPSRRAARALEEARAARAAGDARRALRLYCFALVVGLGASGALAFREAWTNRELLRRGAPGDRARRLLEELIGELEAKEYGREPVREGDLERLERLCREHLVAGGDA